jgi:TonB family protein
MKQVNVVRGMIIPGMLSFFLAFAIIGCTSDKKAEDAEADSTEQSMEDGSADDAADMNAEEADDASGSDEMSGDAAKGSGDGMAASGAMMHDGEVKAVPEEKLEAVEYSGEPMVIAEQWPYFGDCANMESDAEAKHKCSDKAFVQKVASMIQYPEEAIENEAEGKVVVEVIIAEDGTVESSMVVNDLVGYGAAEEALRVVKSAGTWSPAIHKGKPVRFKMLLPVSFQLQD